MAPPRNVILMEENGDSERPKEGLDVVKQVQAMPPGNLQNKEGIAGGNLDIEEKQLVPPKDRHDIEETNVRELNAPGQLKKLSVEELKPADHLDAVKLEQDGMINKDYKKEIFLGNHEEIDDDSLDVAESKLKDIFAK